MENKFAYFKIGEKKFKLEKISDTLYEVVCFNKDKFAGTWCFGRYENAMEHILACAIISEEEYNA